MTEPRKRGFAAMTPERQKEIASKGGRTAHARGTAYEWSPEQARAAGQKGGRVISQDREHMSAIGREGGEARSRQNAIRNRPYLEREATGVRMEGTADLPVSREPEVVQGNLADHGTFLEAKR